MKAPKKTGPPKGQARKPARPRSRTDDACAVGGIHRRRKGAKMKRIGGGLLSVPEEAGRAGGFEFPADPATPKQEEELARIVTEYLRRDFLNRNQQLPNETLAEALGMKPRKAAYMLARIRQGDCHPAADLVVDVIHGMFTGKLAGILGTRRDTTTKWLFKLVRDYDLTEYGLRLRLCYDDDGGSVSTHQYYDNTYIFMSLHSAFRVEYLTWLRRK